MLELPDAEGGEQEAFRAGEGAGSGQFFLTGSRHVVLPWTTPACLGFAADTTRRFAYGEMTGIVHSGGKSSFQASG